MIVKLLTEHHLEFQAAQAGLSESTLVKISKLTSFKNICLIRYLIGYQFLSDKL